MAEIIVTISHDEPCIRLQTDCSIVLHIRKPNGEVLTTNAIDVLVNAARAEVQIAPDQDDLESAGVLYAIQCANEGGAV